jgi:hypothetical protein
MFDVNPLGPMLQLKDLERSAARYFPLAESRGWTFGTLPQGPVRTLGSWIAIHVWRVFPLNRPDSVVTLKHLSDRLWRKWTTTFIDVAASCELP